MNSFGERLRELRKEKKITQKELSNIFKISESAVGMYERNEREPSFELVKGLADFFEVSTDYLLAHRYVQQSGRVNRIAKYIENEVEVMGQSISLSEDEYKVFQEMLKDPVVFNDLKTNPERKVKQLIKLWKVSRDLDDQDDEDEDYIED